MLKIKVSNTQSSSNNYVPNQFNIVTDKGIYFQSYQSVIVFKDKKGQIYLDKNDWDYSRTTGKYRNMFLNETKKETQEKIDNGTYKLIDLN